MQILSALVVLAGALMSNAAPATFGKRAGTTEAGAIASVAGDSFKTISTSLVVPTMSVPTGGDATQTYTGTISVGLATTSGEALTIGVQCTAGATTGCTAVFAYSPAYALQPFPGVSVSAGDVLLISATVNSNTSATVGIVDLSIPTAQYTTYTATTPQGPYTEAKWVVDTGADGLYIDFGTVAYTDTGASTVGGTSVTPANAQTIEELITPDGTTVSSVTINWWGTEIAYV